MHNRDVLLFRGTLLWTDGYGQLPWEKIKYFGSFLRKHIGGLWLASFRGDLTITEHVARQY